mmetsp:Transcript_5457/g.15163  ORF Transcript_5457/g.15163 Transcript_5457/m.15163 type:complete len:340 (-) Transcript_5457:32-1051(-)
MRQACVTAKRGETRSSIIEERHVRHLCCSLDLVLRLGLEVAASVPLVQLLRLLAERAVHHPAALDGGALCDQLRPGEHVRVGLHLQELAGVVEPPQHEVAHPRPDRHVGDGVLLPADVRAPSSEVLVQHVEQPLRLHGVPVDGILDLDRGVVEEVPEAATNERRAPHLPHEPGLALRAQGVLLGEEDAVLVVLLREVEQDRSGLEDAHRLRWVGVVHHRRDLGVGVHGHEAGCELGPADRKQPCIVLEVWKHLDELLKHDRDLHSIRRAERIQLQRMLAFRQRLVLSPSSSEWPVGAAKLTPLLFELPDLRDDVASRQRGLLLGRHGNRRKRQAARLMT